MSQKPPTFSLLADLFEKLTRDHGIELGVADWHRKLIAANDVDDPSEALGSVAAILPHLRPVELTVATKLLADGTRYGESSPTP